MTKWQSPLSDTSTASEPTSSTSVDRCRRGRSTDVVDIGLGAVEAPIRWMWRCSSRLYPIRGMLIAHEGYFGHGEMSVPLQRK